MKDIYYLPDDLFTSRDERLGDVVVKTYSSQEKSIKNKIVLNRHMINLVIQGKKTVVYPHTTGTVNAGELVVLSKGNVLTSELLSTRQQFSSVLFYFTNNWLQDFLRKNKLTATGNGQSGTWNIFKQDAFIKDFIRSIQRLSQTPSLFTNAFKLLKLEELLLYLCVSHPQAAVFLQHISTLSPVDDFTSIIEGNLSSPITIDELAFLCNMSRSTFKRRFEEQYGLSPQKWFVQQRLQLAADLLKSGPTKPSAVYLEVGYDNHSSFSEAFKKFHGLTPSEFKRKG
jgi:AraC family transcriptional regulator, exoenzyme S synthesis regulatory protein ExsA